MSIGSVHHRGVDMLSSGADPEKIDSAQMQLEEKLRSALEELAATDEKLRTTSDQLNAVNEALLARNLRLQSLTSDLENVLSNIDVPLVVLDDDDRVRYSTRAAEWFLGVRPSDVGRSLADLAVSERFPDILSLLRNRHSSDAIHEHQIRSSDERSFLIRISPYRAGGDKAAGNVLAFLDVERVRREAFEESVEMLRALNRLDVIINSTLDTDEIMGLVVDESTSAIAADSAILYRRQGGEWVITHTHGLGSDDLRGRRFADGDLPYLTPEPHFEPMVIDHAMADKRSGPSSQRKRDRRSVMATQLLVRGEVVGILAFGFAEQVRLNETKVDFGRRLASSASVALESARAYEQQRTVADQLQESLMKMPAHLHGVRQAAVYRPATQETRVGGDFYDLFELPGEKVAIMIGDISGKGLIAATLTALARGAIRAHAVDGCSPAVVLKKANNTVFHFTAHESFLTAFFGILDTRTGVLQYASGGHPPGMVVGREGVRALPGTGPLVGAFSDASFGEHSETLSAGEMLVLYTDGITEARSRRGEMYGEEGVVRSLAHARSRTPDAMLTDLIQDALSWADGSLDDDVALLAVKPLLGRESERTPLT